MASPSAAQIQLFQYQKPALESGEYTVHARQLFTPTSSSTPTTFDDDLHFVVSGPRFALDPGAVRAVYPPAGAVGEYSTILPHVALRTPTLPWERSAYANEDHEPWLVLLMIDEADIDRNEVTIPSGSLALGTLATDPGFKYHYESTSADTDPNEQVAYIKVKQKLLGRLMPTGRAMKLRAHVRRRAEADGTTKDSAVVFADRMPRPGAGALCFLVSVEGLYDSASKSFRHGALDSDEWIVLAALTSWKFASSPREGKTFDQLVQDIATGPLALPAEHANADALGHVRVGAAPLWHEMRRSDHTYSWYRGPLSPVRVAPGSTSAFRDVAEFADSLVTYHHGEGMFDVSEAAAFELGKALALNDRAFTSALYDWKGAVNHRVLQRLEAVASGQVLVGAPAGSPTDETLGEAVLVDDERVTFIKEWMNGLADLAPLPFNYLVPDGEMLPPESMRFFDVDNQWVDALLAGAFSIGGMLRTDLVTADVNDSALAQLASGHLPPELAGRLAATLQVDAATLTATFDPTTNRGTVTAAGITYPLAKRATTVVVRDPGLRRRHFDSLIGGSATRSTSGVLVRSQLVRGWPDMFIEGFDQPVDHEKRRPEEFEPLRNLRADRLAPDTLLLFFEGRLEMIEFYLKPEGLHFGLDEHDDGTLWKSTDTGDKPVAWRSMEHRVIDIAGLATAMQPGLDAASFGMEMFEGAAKGRFTREVSE